ncbi:organic cation/carnitine transporter 3-like [Papaver somniferum]|uniref:organic cation/carnitine transporter 3-like n=1 Tax=Papaver somniferum TaxID=3469 RepID=UPI000E6F6CE7|nr:organic cation/carnitine transporter 3-like [Papaver somniferum]
MADTSNLLLNPDDSQTHPLLERYSKTFDETIERFIGSFGWAQLLQAVLVSFAWVFDAQQTFISVFADAEPAWHCIDSHIELCNSTTISNLCKLPRNAWTWNEPIQTSTVSEWGLSCWGPVVAGLPTSSFFFGCLLGGLVLATLADSKLGRKNLLVISCLIMSSSTLLTAFSPNIWIYSILRFVTGFGRATIGTCSLVLSTEIVGKSRRDKVGIIGFICFTLGFLSLPVMAYLTRGYSWRILYILTSVPAIVYSVMVHFMTYESPRWLMVQGRKEEAINTLKSIASPDPDLYGSNNNLLSISLSGIDLSIEPKQSNTDLYASIKLLWDTTWAFRRLSAVMVVSFGVGMMYYGIPLGVGSLASSLYLSVTLNALSELPSSLITYFLIGRLRRRSSMLFFTMLSGFCSIMCVVIHQGQQALRIGVELVSFFSACTAFNVLLIYTLELFPTCVRNSALSMARQALVFGGIFSPILIAAERGVDDNGFLSYGVFGLVIVVCGLFTFCLPETRGEIICDTMEEEEDKKAKNIIVEAPGNKTLVTLV